MRTDACEDVGMLGARRSSGRGGSLRSVLGLLQDGVLPADLADLCKPAGRACHLKIAAHGWQTKAVSAWRGGDQSAHIGRCPDRSGRPAVGSKSACDDIDVVPIASLSAGARCWHSLPANPNHPHSLHWDCGGGAAGSVAPGAQHLPDSGGGPPFSLASAVAVMLVAAAPVEAAEGFGPVVGAMHLIDGLHSTTGLPWWATFAAAAAGRDEPALPSLLQLSSVTDPSLLLVKCSHTPAISNRFGVSSVIVTRFFTLHRPGPVTSNFCYGLQAAVAPARPVSLGLAILALPLELPIGNRR